MIWPGATFGCLGGGQLGKMLGQAARRMGYGFVVFDPGEESPAAGVADHWVRAPYEDAAALDEFVKRVDVVTFEFENIPSEVLQEMASRRPVLPDWQVLFVCQNRGREKCFLREAGFPHVPFEIVESAEDIAKALEKWQSDAVLKTAAFGYDGKGQQKLTAGSDPASAWATFDQPKAVLEQWMDFELECSVICARSREGELTTFPVAENIHTNHILDFSIVPGRLPEKVLKDAVDLAAAITESLKVVGILGVELFVGKDGSVRVNELAPRTHNSGHYTIDACEVSQFEQQLRMVAGLPPGDTALRAPSAVMVNILGDAWRDQPPAWDRILAHPRAHLHLYGKSSPRPGRKMGHFTVTGDDVEATLADARRLKGFLQSP